jgi:hypothetical protein
MQFYPAPIEVDHQGSVAEVNNEAAEMLLFHNCIIFKNNLFIVTIL